MTRRVQGEGGIYYEKARDRWVGQLWLDGKRRKVVGKTKAAVAERIGKLRHGSEAEARADRRMTLSSLLADWQAKAVAGRLARGEISPSTAEAHAWACALWTDAIGTVRLADLDVVKVERALAKMRTTEGKAMSTSSLVKLRSTLRQALAWAERRRVIAHNPAVAVELPTTTAPPRKLAALNPDQLGTLDAAMVDHPLRLLFAVSARLGLRPGEAAGLCADALDLDADPPTVAVVRGVRLVKGRPVLTDEVKTAGSRRVLAVPAALAEALRQYVTDTSPTGLLWTSEDGGPLWPSTVRKELAAACARAAVPKVRPNELRHSAATNLVDAGLSPHQVADILGHTTTRMIDATYRHRPPVIRGADTVDIEPNS
jgi:integrase